MYTLHNIPFNSATTYECHHRLETCKKYRWIHKRGYSPKNYIFLLKSEVITNVDLECGRSWIWSSSGQSKDYKTDVFCFSTKEQR